MGNEYPFLVDLTNFRQLTNNWGDCSSKADVNQPSIQVGTEGNDKQAEDPKVIRKEERNPFEKKARKKTSCVWDNFDIVTLSDGSKKSQLIVDVLYKCIIGWGIENKAASITVDNASYNDLALKNLQGTFKLLKKKLLFDAYLMLSAALEFKDVFLVSIQLLIYFLLRTIYELYNEYIAMHSQAYNELISQQSTTEADSLNSASLGRKVVTGRSQYESFVRQSDSIQPVKSDLDIYLEEGVYICQQGMDSQFDALEWWKANSLKYRILSKMARDILSVPITSVASESTFSAGSKVIDPYRASLATETIEMLLCGAD
ncbi:hypothetical protein RHSIM_Rhsim09G0098000 [Rhododendron simsii]|uniref:HAT C-terminal dimerisation domain-containing protein n=1 Tax=Rhododendron simsii TaxID=118357 RepID=A0A834LFM0_RHOSS|nr:hypothetical protein RHSIM_Rhsim09G0098000 [Rhododendron simsii]